MRTTKNFITIFDSLFLPQGLALYLSLKRHISDDILFWIICADQKCYEVLNKLDLSQVFLVNLGDVETPELISIKPLRTPREYFWTLSPILPEIAFGMDKSLQQITFLDADMWLRRSPDELYREFELSGKAIFITEHGFSSDADNSDLYGRFCVQFIIYNREGSSQVIKEWKDKCIQWCQAEVSQGRFGDQKYLDEWPDRYPDLIHINVCDEHFLGPWNINRFPFAKAIFVHFQGLRIVSSKIVQLPMLRLSEGYKRSVLSNYIVDLNQSVQMLRRVQHEVVPQCSRRPLFVRLKNLFYNLRSLGRTCFPRDSYKL